MTRDSRGYPKMVAPETVDYDLASLAYGRLKWPWYRVGVPTATDIRDTVDELIKGVHEWDEGIATGGIMVSNASGEMLVGFHLRLQKSMNEIIAGGQIDYAPQSRGAWSKERSMNKEQIEATARAAHEANRAWCIAHGDMSQSAWDDAPDWQRTSAVNGIHGVLGGNTPEQSHESWLAEKTAAGWKYGAIKDAEKKEHPCFVPYSELPPEQKAKDGIFVAVARAFIRAFGHSDG